MPGAVRTVVGLRPNPTVDTQIENVVGSGRYRGFNQAETTVWLAIPIELGGKRSARIAVADAQVHRSLLQSAMARADIRLQVRQLYVEAVAAERRLAISYDQLRIARDAAEAAGIRVRAGRASPFEEQDLHPDGAHRHHRAGWRLHSLAHLRPGDARHLAVQGGGGEDEPVWAKPATAGQGVCVRRCQRPAWRQPLS